MRNFLVFAMIGGTISTSAMAQDQRVSRFDPICIARKAKGCVDKISNQSQTNAVLCRESGGTFVPQAGMIFVDKCNYTDFAVSHLAMQCEARARVYNSEGEDCARTDASSDALIAVIRQDMLEAIKAVLEEARDAKPK